MKTLLVIDDEESVRYSFRSIFSLKDINVVTAATAAEGLKLLDETHPDVVVVDLRLPDKTGLEFFADLRSRMAQSQISDSKLPDQTALGNLRSDIPVIFITAHGTTQAALEAMKKGAFDYLIKPLDLDRLVQVIDRAFDSVQQTVVPASLPSDDLSDHIIGRSQVMQEMCKTIGRIAPQDVNVLILGESGTGKELVARALCAHSKRADKPFLDINCAAIPEALLESELFGHEAGAFTGAAKRHIGKFERSSGGTLFLDEIGDMPLVLQGKILRVLQEQRFERVGGHESVSTQVRVLAATNQDLPKLIDMGRFRKDLYYRLNAVTIQVPPLRDHADDIAELAHYFLFRLNRELGLDLRGFAPEALESFQAYPWPGNVRELQGAIKHAMLSSSGRLLLPEFLPDYLFPQSKNNSAPPTLNASYDLGAIIDDVLKQPGLEGQLYDQVLAVVERVLFTKVLQLTHGNQGKASDLLGLNRSTLRQRLRTLGLTLDKVPVPVAEADSGPGTQEKKGE